MRSRQSGARCVRACGVVVLALCALMVWSGCGDDGAADGATSTNNATNTSGGTSTNAGTTGGTTGGPTNGTNNSTTATNNGATSTNNASTGTNNGTSTSTNNATTVDGDLFVGELPPLSALTAEVVEMQPGGETVCSRGTEYAFWVKPGDPEKVMIYFNGGGACWNQTTCSFADALFDPNINGIRGAIESRNVGGIFDLEREDNPFRDWTWLIIPYCTGDIHWGNRTATYGEGADAVTIEHRGALNTQVTLDWLYASVPDPEALFVTGCSAGSYGSVLWGLHLMERYPDARIAQFGDSGAGIITDQFFRESFPSWNAVEAFPDWVDGLDFEGDALFELELADMYIEGGNYYPQHTMTQFHTIYDNNQVFFFEAMGGGGADAWARRMLGSMERIQSNTENFRAYLAPGDDHCIVPYDAFYEVEADGVKLVDWVTALAEGEDPGNVNCDACDKPE